MQVEVDDKELEEIDAFARLSAAILNKMRKMIGMREVLRKCPLCNQELVHPARVLADGTIVHKRDSEEWSKGPKLKHLPGAYADVMEGCCGNVGKTVICFSYGKSVYEWTCDACGKKYVQDTKGDLVPKDDVVIAINAVIDKATRRSGERVFSSREIINAIEDLHPWTIKGIIESVLVKEGKIFQSGRASYTLRAHKVKITSPLGEERLVEVGSRDIKRVQNQEITERLMKVAGIPDSEREWKWITEEDKKKLMISRGLIDDIDWFGYALMEGIKVRGIDDVKGEEDVQM